MAKRRTRKGKQQPRCKKQKCDEPKLRVPIRIVYENDDPIVEHFRDNYVKLPISDRDVIDQISLEGLSGVTLSRLFILLDAVYPSLEACKNENSQEFIWTIVVRSMKQSENTSIEDRALSIYYVNPKDRESVINQNVDQDTKPTDTRSSSKGVVFDRPIILPPRTVENYKLSGSEIIPIQDGSIMGHCPDYTIRIDITEELLKFNSKNSGLDCMHHLEKKYALENVFIVANQQLRMKSILPNWTDPNINMISREYSTLEFIGKFRTLGAVFPKDKAIGRYRMSLTFKGFISQYQRASSAPIEHVLKRFAQYRKSSEKNTCVDTQLYDDDCMNTPGERATLTFLDPGKLKPNRGVLNTIYQTIARSPIGLTKQEIRRRIHIPRSHLRNHLKNLVNLKMVCVKANGKTEDGSYKFKLFKTAHKYIDKIMVPEKTSQLNLTNPILTSSDRFDEIDCNAKRIIGQKRSSFSQAEDFLLLVCRITSLLVQPGLRLTWCVHKRVVRDLLHRELIESRDKTSDACLRRGKYLRQLPDNIMLINELTAELQDELDIQRILERRPSESSDERITRAFLRTLKLVRRKMPDLVGIFDLTKKKFDEECNIVVSNYEDLCSRFQMVDCQSLASMTRSSPTYEQSKNIVDVKLNNACLVTMATMLANSMAPDPASKKLGQMLLDKFYSSYQDKMISSVLSKLSKRSLLTKKCTIEQASLTRPRSSMSLKLNQSILFLLNRYQSTSMMQLIGPLNENYRLDLDESNEMSSIAALTSFCSQTTFSQIDLDFRIPARIVETDCFYDDLRDNIKNDCRIVHPCKVRFHSEESMTICREPMDQFIEAAGSNIRVLSSKERKARKVNRKSSAVIGRSAAAASGNSGFQQGKESEQDTTTTTTSSTIMTSNGPSDVWLVMGYRVLLTNQDEQQTKELNRRGKGTFKRGGSSEAAGDSSTPTSTTNERIQLEPIEFSARLWKTVDGQVHLGILMKLIESLLSWIIVLPGIVHEHLAREFGHLLPEEHLSELLELMQSLDLITKFTCIRKRLALFGEACLASHPVITYEVNPLSYIRFGQLMRVYHNNNYGSFTNDALKRKKVDCQSD